MIFCQIRLLANQSTDFYFCYISPAAQRSEPSWKLTNFYPYYREKSSNHARNQVSARSGVVGVARVRG